MFCIHESCNVLCKLVLILAHTSAVRFVENDRTWFLMTVCYYHVTYEFQSEPTQYSLPERQETKKLLARSLHHIWSLSDSNAIRTHNHLFCKRTLNHLAKLAKWLSCVVNTCLYSAFDCILLSCHVRVSEWTKWLWVRMALVSHSF